MIESRRMEPSERNKFLALMSFHLLWGVVLWFSISKLGLGVSTDSVHLLFGGMNLAETGRLISFDGSPLLQWPPLYPVLLAGIRLATGIGAFGAAHLLQATAYVGLSICTSLLFLRIFPEDFALAVAGCVLADIGAVVVAGFDLVGSDYVHLFLVTLFLLLTAQYLDTSSPKAFVTMVLVGLLAMLDRYLGMAAIATGAVALLFLASGSRRSLACLYSCCSCQLDGISPVRSSGKLSAGAWFGSWKTLLEERSRSASFVGTCPSSNLTSRTSLSTGWRVPKKFLTLTRIVC